MVLSHEHPDHWSDLEGFYVACRYVQGRSGVPVYAPQGLRDLLRMGPTGEHPRLARHRRRATSSTIGPMTLSFFRTDHPPETLAVRVDAGGRSLGYSADSGPGWSLAALGPGLHLALVRGHVPAGGRGIRAPSECPPSRRHGPGGRGRAPAHHPSLADDRSGRGPGRGGRRRSAARSRWPPSTRPTWHEARRPATRRAAPGVVSSATTPSLPWARSWSRWGAPRCCARRRSRRTCPAG